jgi:hypothetical protein
MSDGVLRIANYPPLAQMPEVGYVIKNLGPAEIDVKDRTPGRRLSINYQI